MAATVGIGLLGLGTVGSAVAARLISRWELLAARAGATPVLRRVAVRDLSRARDVDLRNVPVVDDPLAVVDDPAVEIVVEVIGGLQPSTSLIQRALDAGKSVVTANKAVIAATGPALVDRAVAHGAAIRFEASVGAGLPVVALLQHGLGGDVVSSIDAVINGTTNVILTRMRDEGVGFDAALREAQRRGFAEADAGDDVDGWDAANKLVIMAWLAFGAHADVREVDRSGIGTLPREDLAYTGQLGYAVKLLAHAERVVGTEQLHLRVRPTAVPDGHALFGVDDSDNAVIIKSDQAGTIMLSGVGAGGASTASAVVADIVDAVRQRGQPMRPLPARPAPPASPEDVDVSGYIRLVIDGSADARALVLQALEDRGVPVVEAAGRPPLDGPHPQLLVLTGSAPRAVHERALETLDTLPVVRRVVCAIDRIEPAA